MNALDSYEYKGDPPNEKMPEPDGCFRIVLIFFGLVLMAVSGFAVVFSIALWDADRSWVFATVFFVLLFIGGLKLIVRW